MKDGLVGSEMCIRDRRGTVLSAQEIPIHCGQRQKDCLSVCFSATVSVSLSLSLSVCLSLCVCLSLSQSLSLFLSLAVCLSLSVCHCLFISLSLPPAPPLSLIKFTHLVCLTRLPRSQVHTAWYSSISPRNSNSLWPKTERLFNTNTGFSAFQTSVQQQNYVAHARLQCNVCDDTYPSPAESW